MKGQITFFLLWWRHINCLFKSSSRLTTKKNQNTSYYWPFLLGIHRWPVDSQHKGRVMQKVYSCNDVSMIPLWVPLLQYWYQKIPWAPSQYPKRSLIVRSREVSKARDWYFKLSYRFEIWQAHRQQCCRSACQTQGDRTILNTNLAASRLHGILR